MVDNDCAEQWKAKVELRGRESDRERERESTNESLTSKHGNHATFI